MEDKNSASSSFESLSASFPIDFPKYPSFKKLVGSRSPRFFLSEEEDGVRHFLDSCHFCKRPIGCGRDIFMYRGDMPFCSEECRQEQIDIDEANLKKTKISQKQQKGKNSSPEKIQVRATGTVVAVDT